MSSSIYQHFADGYSTTTYALAQQKESKLISCVRVESRKNNVDFFNTLAAAGSYEKTTRFQDAAFSEMVHDRRAIAYSTVAFTPGIDGEDLQSLLVDPTSNYVQAGAKEFGRNMDSVIITAALGSALTGQYGTTTVAFDTANQQIAAGGTGLTLTKLLSAKEKFDNADYSDDERYIVITGTQLKDLLNTTEVKSADYNSVKALVAGEVDTFMGFKFKRVSTNILPVDGSGNRRVVAFTKDAMVFSKGTMTSKVVERTDKIDTKQLQATLSMGAVRMEEKGVAEILCA